MSEIQILMGWGQCKLKYRRHSREVSVGACHSASADNTSSRKTTRVSTEVLKSLL